MLLPDLVADVRRKRAEQLQERFELGSVAAVVRQGGRQRHERGQRGVALERIDVRRDLADRLVQDGLVLGRVCRLVIGDGLGQIPYLVEKALAALHGVRRPRGGLLEIADEDDIGAHGVRTVFSDDIRGVDDIAAGVT